MVKSRQAKTLANENVLTLHTHHHCPNCDKYYIIAFHHYL
jgi:hypothetical protein